MKHYFLLLAALLSFTADAQDFVTRWVFPQPSNTLTFNGVTEGEVLCKWSTSSNPAGGTLRFSNTNENLPVILAIPIPAGDTLTLQMEPANLRRFFLNGGYNGSNKNELTEIRQWGNVPWQSMEVAFNACPNLKVVATDVPNLTGVKSLKQMFWYSRSFTPPSNIDLWDVSGVTDMESMFAETGSFNRQLGAWKLNSLVNAAGMFSNSGISCENYSRTLKGWAENPNTARDVSFAFQRGAVYSNTAAPFRNTLIAKGWSITMDGQAAPGSACYDIALPVTFGNISAALKNGNLQVKWATLTETNNSHFEVEASADGSNFTKIGRVLSKAQEGNSSEQLNYEFSSNMHTTVFAVCIGMLLLGSACLRFRRCRKHLLLLAMAGAGLSMAGCAKNGSYFEDNNTNLYVRIKQVDKDENFKYSKVVKAVNE